MVWMIMVNGLMRVIPPERSKGKILPVPVALEPVDDRI